MKKIYEDEKVEVFSDISPEYREAIIDVDVLSSVDRTHYGQLAYITGPSLTGDFAQFKAVEKEHIEDIEDYLIGVIN